MQLFNTLTGRSEEFTAEGDVSLYVCGVTPYDTTHIGHARTYLVFDVLIRELIHHGFKVDYVQNITDVDESILQRAAERGESYDELGERYTSIYIEDIAALGMIPAASYPRATEAIPYIHEVIRRLLATGHAYRVDGTVYFRVASVESYGSLSRLDRRRMLDIETEQDDSTVDDERKEDPLDFALWRAASDDGPRWESPWGPGRPGWHVECSTLALKHLGKQIDIHGGGADLIFPHHEAEIVQSEAVTGVSPFARFWVHVEMARCDGEKMSKSKGNMVFVRDLLEHYSPDALRLYLLATPYREPLDFDEAAVKGAAELAARLAEAARSGGRGPGAEIDAEPFARTLDAALEDDLDTPRAIAALDELASRILASGDAGTYTARRTLRRLVSRLGLSLAPMR